MITTQQFAKNWLAGMQTASQKIKDKVQAVSEAPGAKAAAAEAEWAAGVLRAQAEGKFRDRVASVSLESWKKAMINKGLPRMGPGAAEAIPLVEQFAAQLLPHAERAKQEVAAMPRGKGENAKARMLRNFEIMSQFRFQRR